MKSHLSVAAEPEQTKTQTPLFFVDSSISKQSSLYFSTLVVLGSPSKNCEGVGLCRVVPRKPHLASRPYENKRCPRIPSWLVLHQNDHALSLFFYHRAVTDKLLTRHCIGDYFCMEEACALPSVLVKHFGLQDCTIPAGVYEVVRTASHIEVRFGNINFNVH